MRISCKYLWLPPLAIVLLYLLGLKLAPNEKPTVVQIYGVPAVPFDVPAIEKGGDCIPIPNKGNDFVILSPCPQSPPDAVITNGKTHQYGWYLAPNCEDKRRVLLTSGDNQHHCYLFSLLDSTLSR
jgi:hypothetical protein